MDVGGDAAVLLGNVVQNDTDQPSNLNISDVFDAISLADPSFDAGVPSVDEAMSHTQSQQQAAPYVRVVQQPASKALRFRYECEGRSAGSIPGASSTPENRTYPTIKIFNYTGNVTIVVSCVTKDEPYRPHPHNLVGRDHCDRGVFSVRTEITDENNEYQFRNLGIQCVKRRDIGEALRIREEIRVDPFKTGFSHRNHPQGIDLNAVRLAFQVFMPHSSGKMRRYLAPVVSDVIYDKKAMSDLLIMRASHCSGPARGGTQVILLCEKVTREDTVVVFYQEENNRVLWEESAIIIVVHKQYAIAFETPPYRNPHISENVNVKFQLRRQSDKMTSNSLPFEYICEYQDSSYIGSKRRKTLIPSLMQSYEQDRGFQQEQKPIKVEPGDKSSPHHMSTSPLHVYPTYGDNWNMGMEPLQGNLTMAGPSGQGQGGQGGQGGTFGEMQWSYAQLAPLQPASMHSPHHQLLSPNVQVVPNMGHSPMHRVVSPMGQSIHDVGSPMGQSMHGTPSPMAPSMHGATSPMGHSMHGATSPMGHSMHGATSPMGHSMHGTPSPMGQSMHGATSPMGQPMHGAVSPNLVQHTDYAQAEGAGAAGATGAVGGAGTSTSLSALLGRGDDAALTSSELLGLSALLDERTPDLLSTDLNRLSTNEMLFSEPHTQPDRLANALPQQSPVLYRR